MMLALEVIGIVLLLGGAVWFGLWYLQHREDHKRERDLTFLQITMPKKESKEDKEVESEQFSTGKDFREVLGVMDHLFQSLHGLYNTKPDRFWKGQPFFSVEYGALAGEIL